MKKLISALLFLIYLLTSIVYIDLYEFKNVRNILWKNNNVSVLYMMGIKNINSSKELINILEDISTKHNVSISKVVYKNKTSSGKRKIKIYTTCNDKTFNNIKLDSGRTLKNEDLPSSFITSEKTDDKDQVGKINFFNLNSILEIHNLSGILFNGESIGGGWFIDKKDKNKISLIKNDLKEKLDCEDIETFNFSAGDIDATQSDEAYSLKEHMITVLIVLYVMTFLTVIYWIFSIYKKLAIKKIFGESNISLKLKIIFKDFLNIHIYGLSLSGLIIFSFLIYKLGLNNIDIFFLSWIKFIFILTLISLCLLFIPLILTKYIQIPLMIKNKKPVKIIQNINNISKCFIGVIATTIIINNSNSLYWLYNKNIENKIWNNSLHYSLVKTYATFSGTVAGRDDEEKVHELHKNMKRWFKICNEKGAIYINAINHRVGRDTYEEQKRLIENIKQDKTDELLGKSIKVNNNYLQLNPIYDVAGRQINIPDHDEHTLNLLVPQSLKKYEDKVKEKYTGKFYNDDWPDYKLNIIYIKDNQKCFTYKANLATETQNYVIGSIIQVISNNNMYIDSYGCCACNGFYPKITNIDNPYQELLPDIKACGVDKVLLTADVLYEVAAKDVYETEQQLIKTIEYAIFAVLLLIMLIISTCINYLEENKISNVIKKLNGVGFMSRSANLIKSSTLIWLISICLMIILNYKEEMIGKIASWLFIPSDVILIHKLVPGGYFYLNLIDWKIVFGVILSDLIISTIFLKIYENKKISSVLKGE